MLLSELVWADALHLWPPPSRSSSATSGNPVPGSRSFIASAAARARSAVSGGGSTSVAEKAPRHQLERPPRRPGAAPMGVSPPYAMLRRFTDSGYWRRRSTKLIV